MQLPANQPCSPAGEHTGEVPVLPADKVAKVGARQQLAAKICNLWDAIRIFTFVVGSAFIVFVAARNSITWQLQRLWGASGSYWQSHWEKLYDQLGGGSDKFCIIGTFIITNSVFFLFNLFLSILDLTGKPQALLKYKIQPEKNCPLDQTRFAKTVGWVVFNQTVVGIPVFITCYRAMLWRGCDFGRDLPTFHWVLVELVMFAFIEEFFFYYGHRLFHHRLLYKHIHKMHHEWTAPIGITAIYAHPIEHVLCNMLPPIMGPLIMGSHIATAWLWFSLALISTSVSHCGYHFPLLPSPEAHDFHHLKFTNNFGVLGVLDRLHGTDSMFRASTAYKRHMMLLTLTPLSVQYPDNTKSPKHKAQ